MDMGGPGVWYHGEREMLTSAKSYELVPLHCPTCLAPLVEQSDSLVCNSCIRSYPLVRGIPVLQEEQPYFGEFTREQMKFFLERAAFDTEIALRDLLRLGQAPPRLGEYILGEGRAGWCFLLPLHPGVTALDLGCGWGAVSYSLARTCRCVVAMDSTLERMEFLRYRTIQRGLNNIQFVCAGSAGHLPFPDASFDIVVVNGVLEWVPCGRSGHPTLVQAEFLREVRRILRPSGVLYLGIENRYSWKTWFREPDGHTGLRFVPWLPRVLASAYSRLWGAGPYRNYLYGKRGYRRLLTQAGFIDLEFHVPLPGYHHPTTIIPADARREIARSFVRPARGILQRIRSRIRGMLTSYFPESFSILASGAAKIRSYLDRLCSELAARDESLFPSDVRRALYRINGEMGVVTAVMKRKTDGRGFVIKLPLHERGEESLKRESNWFDQGRLTTGPLAPFRDLLPALLVAGEFDGSYFAAFRLLPGVSADRLVGRVWRGFLALDEATAFATSLHRLTSANESAWDVWIQNTVESNVRLVRKLTASAKQEAALDRLADALLRSLATFENLTVLGHGDYKIANCLFDPQNGRLTGILDWGAGLQPELPLYDISFLYVDYAASLGFASIREGIRHWLAGREPFSGAKTKLEKIVQELGLTWNDDRYRTLGLYQWLKRMAPLGTGHESRRFDYRYVDGMFDVIIEAGF